MLYRFYVEIEENQYVVFYIQQHIFFTLIW